jgi:uncharacterized protein with PQ loop repeat
MLETLGMVAGIVLPFWNIPLIVRIQRRRSSEDLSLFWALGVWGCFALMLPAALTSPDKVFKVFSIVNIFFFTIVTFQVVRFRGKR